jgi:hypothetical protein
LSKGSKQVHLINGKIIDHAGRCKCLIGVLKSAILPRLMKTIVGEIVKRLVIDLSGLIKPFRVSCEIEVSQIWKA